jgi:hypothetical protein
MTTNPEPRITGILMEGIPGIPFKTWIPGITNNDVQAQHFICFESDFAYCGIMIKPFKNQIQAVEWLESVEQQTFHIPQKVECEFTIKIAQISSGFLLIKGSNFSLHPDDIFSDDEVFRGDEPSVISPYCDSQVVVFSPWGADISYEGERLHKVIKWID